MLFRSLSLLCGAKDVNVRLHELVGASRGPFKRSFKGFEAINRWGRGLLDLAKLRLGFAAPRHAEARELCLLRILSSLAGLVLRGSIRS